MDVDLTRDIYLFAKQHGYLLIFDMKQNMQRRIQVSW